MSNTTTTPTAHDIYKSICDTAETRPLQRALDEFRRANRDVRHNLDRVQSIAAKMFDEATTGEGYVVIGSSGSPSNDPTEYAHRAAIAAATQNAAAYKCYDIATLVGVTDDTVTMLLEFIINEEH